MKPTMQWLLERLGVAFFLALYSPAAFSLAQNPVAPPLLGKPEDILVSGKPLRIGNTPAPLASDFDHDGKKDLILGEFAGDNSRCRIYRNVGTDAAPKFSDYTFLQAGGKDAVMDGA
jgi:hypothetical protein